MREGWRRVVLGDVLKLEIDYVKVDPLATYRLAGVYSFGRGLFERERLLGAKTSYKLLHRLRRGQLVMSKLKAWEGALAVVPESFHGFVLSPEFPTFTTSDDLDPQFLTLLCGEPSFWQILQGRSQGIGGRRERVHPGQLLGIPVILPPLHEQRRIVDLVAAVDKCAAAVGEEQDAVRNTLRSFRETRLTELASETSTVGDVLLGIEAGRSPAAMDRLPTPGERAVLKVSAIRPGVFDPTQVKTVGNDTALPAGSRVNVGDILMTRASGTRSLVGAVCRVEEVPDRYFLCDKTLRLVPKQERVIPSFLVEALQSELAREQIELGATGTASMKNISQQSIRLLRIPLPSIQDQVTLVSILNDVRAVQVALTMEDQALADVRSAIARSLLSGEHHIPGSYDELLEAVG